MLINAVFQVNKNEVKGKYNHAAGRLINDMDITDNHIILKELGLPKISANDLERPFHINDSNDIERINIIDIISYGRSFEVLNGGMSALIICQSDIELAEWDLICRVIN